MNKNKNRGCGSWLVGTLAVLAAVLIFSLLTSLLSRLFVGMRLGDTPAVALLTFSMTAIGIAFFLFEAVFVVWQIKLSASVGGDSEMANKMGKLLKLIFVLCIVLSLLLAVFSANTYTECREDSISKVCFVTTKEYRWDIRNDVLRYTFSCDEGGGLTYNITMKDGEVIELLGAINTISDSFREKYDTSNANLLAYAAMLSRQFDESEYIIEKKINGVEYMETLYKEARPEIWVYIEEIIH